MTTTTSISARERLIVALDVSTAAEARSIVSELTGIVGAFKVGLQLFSAEGPSLVRELVGSGQRVFLDLKFHDIPNTVAMASAEAAKLGVWMFNVHASGGVDMMLRALRSATDAAAKASIPRPLITAVTVLTSDEGDQISEMVTERTWAAKQAGLDGVVASAREAAMIRQTGALADMTIVTPGIRPMSGTNDDQKRVMSPGSAILAGADHIVVGRPILNAEDRAGAASAIVAEIEQALEADI